MDKREDSFKDKIHYYIEMDPGAAMQKKGEKLFQAYRSSENKEEFKKKAILVVNRLMVSTKEKLK